MAIPNKHPQSPEWRHVILKAWWKAAKESHGMKNALRYVAIIVVCFTALVFALCFWPGVYSYETAGIGVGSSGFLVRIHRITGDTEMFLPTSRSWEGEKD